jgi:hypothetical protein
MVTAISATCATLIDVDAVLLLVIESTTPLGGVTITVELMLVAVVLGETIPEIVNVTTPLLGSKSPDQIPVSGSYVPLLGV